MKHNLLLLKQNKKRKVENILAQNFVLFLCFIFSWEQTLRFRFENKWTLKVKGWESKQNRQLKTTKKGCGSGESNNNEEPC